MSPSTKLPNSITDYNSLPFDQSRKVIREKWNQLSRDRDKWQDVHTHIVIQLWDCQYSEQKFALSSKYPKASSPCMSALSNHIDCLSRFTSTFKRPGLLIKLRCLFSQFNFSPHHIAGNEMFGKRQMLCLIDRENFFLAITKRQILRYGSINCHFVSDKTIHPL